MASEAPRVDFELCIVGGGVVGCCSALAAAERFAGDSARKVCLLERHALGSGTSWHSGGYVRPYDASGGSTHRLMATSYRRYDQLAKRRPRVFAARNGGLSLARSEASVAGLRQLAEVLKKDSVAFEWLAVDEISRRWPDINPAGVRAALFVHDEGRVVPAKVCRAAAAEARRLGAEVFEDTAVVDIVPWEGGTQLELADGRRLRCRWLLLSCGLWTPELASKLGVQLPMRPVTEQFVVPRAQLSPQLPVVKDADLPLWGGIFDEKGRVCLGSVTALEPVIDPGDPALRKPHCRLPLVWAEGDVEEGCSRMREPLAAPSVAAMQGRLRNSRDIYAALRHNLFPALSRAGPELFWGCSGPEAATPDLKPYVGPSGAPGVLVAAGFTGHGVQLAAGVAELVAMAVAGLEVSWPPHWAPDRFLGAFTDEAEITARVAAAHGGGDLLRPHLAGGDSAEVASGAPSPAARL